MSRAESLALELDSLKLELEKLKAENARLRSKDSNTDGSEELRESYEQIVSDLLLKDQEIADLNGRLETVSSERDTALAQVVQTKDVAELELHRKLAQERSKWEAREERWAKQLASMECEVERQVRLSTARSESPQLPEHSASQEVSHYASPLAMAVTPTTPCTSTEA